MEIGFPVLLWSKMVKSGSDVHAFCDGQKERKSWRGEKEVITFIGQKVSSHPNRKAASMLHKDMVLGDGVIGSNKFG